MWFLRCATSFKIIGLERAGGGSISGYLAIGVVRVQQKVSGRILIKLIKGYIRAFRGVLG